MEQATRAASGHQAMDSDSTSQVGAQAEYQAAARRDPRRAGWGYVAADPASGAVGELLWFATPAELKAFLAGPEVELLGFDGAESRRIASSVRRVLRDSGALERVDRDLLSACFEGWTEILWLGSFAELRERGGPVATATRAEFRRRRGGGPDAAPITDDEVEDFVAFLRTLGR